MPSVLPSVRCIVVRAQQRCLTRAAKHEPQNVNIMKELRNLTKLAQEDGVEVGIDPATIA